MLNAYVVTASFTPLPPFAALRDDAACLPAFARRHACFDAFRHDIDVFDAMPPLRLRFSPCHDTDFRRCRQASPIDDFLSSFAGQLMPFSSPLFSPLYFFFAFIF